jgi:hypothetical protein
MLQVIVKVKKVVVMMILDPKRQTKAEKGRG